MAGTIRQIAEVTGVSRGTVDRVLNDRGRVRTDVAARVRRAADEMGYVIKHPKMEGIVPFVLPGDRKKCVGVITQLSETLFMDEINRGIAAATKKLRDQGVRVLLSESTVVDEKEQLRQIEEITAQGIDGLAIMAVNCDGVRSKLNQLINEKGIPVVTFNSDIAGTERMCFVGLDNWQSGRTAAGLMGMMMRGSGKVLAITGNFANSACSSRIAGFVEELKDTFPEMKMVGVQSSFDRSDEVEQIIVQTMGAFPDLEGIVVVSGGQAGVKRAFEQLNLGKEKRPYVILWDQTPRNVSYLQDGYADFLIDQAGYTQSYRALSLLSERVRLGRKPDQEYIYMDIQIRTKYNL